MAAGTVRFVTASWVAAQQRVSLRIEANEPGCSQEFLMSVSDTESLVNLLLVLGGRTGLSAPESFGRPMVPLPVDSLALGETTEGETIIELCVGPAALAFKLPAGATRQLGQSLFALSASPQSGTA